jgi:hypothetical protein
MDVDHLVDGVDVCFVMPELYQACCNGNLTYEIPEEIIIRMTLKPTVLCFLVQPSQHVSVFGLKRFPVDRSQSRMIAVDPKLSVYTAMYRSQKQSTPY